MKGVKSDRNTAIRDIVLILAIALVGLCLLFFNGRKTTPGSSVVVEVDGKTVASYPLDTDGVFVLNGGTNTLEIKDGKARISDADCPNMQCVRQGWISRGGQSIVCLPNKLIVTVTSSDRSVDYIL
jgi:hypothetical protein